MTCLSFGQGEKSEELLSGGQDGAIKLWDARSKRMLCSAMTHAGAAKGETPVATLVRLGEVSLHTHAPIQHIYTIHIVHIYIHI